MEGENTQVAQYMIMHQLSGYGSIITGSSVHIHGIERLWRDVFTECTSYYYALFYAFEDSGLLNHCVEMQIFLHCIMCF
jgi:hypothetical protein